jgi:hypothetical protein
MGCALPTLLPSAAPQRRVMRSLRYPVLHTCTLVLLLPQSHSDATLGYVDQLQDQAFDTLKGKTQQQQQRRQRQGTAAAAAATRYSRAAELSSFAEGSLGSS